MSVPLAPLVPTGRRSVRIRRIATIAGWMALTVCFFEPATYVLDGKLDPSIFSAYAYFTAHGFQFGPEVVAMAGPYGFIMYGSFYGGELFWLRLTGELVVQGVLAALVLWFFLQQPARSWWRWLWFPAHILFTSLIADLTVAWTMLLAGLFLLENRSFHRGAVLPALAAGVLSLLALFKGTHLMLSLATLAVVMAAWILDGGWRRAALFGGAYFTSLLGFWILARQNPLHLPAYLAGALHLTQSYNSAMSLEEPAHIFRRGVTLVGGLGLAIAATAWAWRRDGFRLAGLALLAGYLFVSWKHGFVRADGHVFIFFCFAVVAVLAWYLHFIAREPGLPHRSRLAARAVVVLLLLAALLGRPDPLRPGLVSHLVNAWPGFVHRLEYLVTLPRGRDRIEQRLEEQRELAMLPETGEIIGRASIDFFGFEQGVLPLNRFNYHPRPMGGGAFNVYDRYLMELNRDFLRDPARRPEYYLVRFDTIDDRLATQDDGLALRELIFGYRPIRLERNFLLMRAEADATAPAPELLARQTFRFGESVTVPRVNSRQILLVRFDIRPSVRGRLRAALYKPPPVAITLYNGASEEIGTRRLVPPMAASPFILSPLIEDSRDLLDLYDEQPGQSVGGLVISTTGASSYVNELTVEFHVLPRPPEMDDDALSGLRSRFEFPFANLVPESISPAFRPHNLVRFLHPPAEIVWQLEGQERKLTFDYGLDPQAYERGTTNGVEFIVEIRSPSGAAQRVFNRLLRPLSDPAEQGRHRAHVTLPVFAPGSRLVLRTDAGEHGDTAWDWAYVTRIEIESGAYSPEQFPGFNRVPDAAHAESSSVLEHEGRQVFLLHVPGALEFVLTGSEEQLSLDFGFLPGAYTGEGRTDGAHFTVEWIRPGQAPQEVHRRTLRPVEEAADRGEQTATIGLPEVAAGDRIIVRTRTIEGGTNSWGWTYLSRLTFD